MSQRIHLFVFICFSTISGTCTVHAQPFSEVAVFDASQSNGSVRSSNGLLWSEWLASQLNLPTAEQNGASHWVTFVSELDSAVTRYLEAHTPNDGTLIILGNLGPDAGMSDAQYWSEMSRQISRLAGNGAGHFIVNRVDYLGYSQRFPAFRDIIREQNEIGDPILRQLAAELGVSIYRPSVEGFSGFIAVLDEPNNFGFTDVMGRADAGVANPHEYVWWDDGHLTTAAHRQLALDAFRSLGVSIEPTKVQIVSKGDSYLEDFDMTLGGINTPLPKGWVGATDDAIYTSVTGSFSNHIAAGGTLYNVGPRSGGEDRALALGITDGNQQNELQFHAQVNDNDIERMRLQFDLEVWGVNSDLATDPGEAAFSVTLDVDAGNGFMRMVDLGTVTTGPTLEPSVEGIVDGNADAYRLSFDSGAVPVAIPDGATIRIRWMSAAAAETAGWVFGLDNVALSLLGSGSQAGDFNGDGVLSVADLDALTAAVMAGTNESQFDVDGSGNVDADDRTYWIADIKGTIFGDVNFDRIVDSTDLNAVGLNWQSTTATSWLQGDFNGDGNVDSTDLNDVGRNWQKNAAAQASTAPVPEPSGVFLLAMGFAWLAILRAGFVEKGTCVRRRA